MWRGSGFHRPLPLPFAQSPQGHLLAWVPYAHRGAFLSFLIFFTKCPLLPALVGIALLTAENSGGFRPFVRLRAASTLPPGPGLALHGSQMLQN